MTAPIDWTADLVERICSELASGRSIREIATDTWCPSEPSIYREMAKNSDFAKLITEARAAQQDYEADHVVTMADNATEDDWQVVKLRIWARQWRASKLASKKYGDKIDLTSAGGPLSVAIIDPRRRGEN